MDIFPPYPDVCVPRPFPHFKTEKRCPIIIRAIGPMSIQNNLGFPQLSKVQWAYHYGVMAKRKTEEVDGEITRGARLIIPLTGDNEVDWSAVRPAAKEQLLNIANNDVTILEHIGMAHESGNNDDGESSDFEGDITQANVKMLLDSLTKANAIVAAMIIPRFVSHPFKRRADGKRVPFTIDRNIALSNFALTESQHAELDPRAERLAKKYMPAAARKHLDVIMLASMYMHYMEQNLEATVKAQVKYDIANVQSAPQVAPPQAPIESDVSVKPNGHAPESVPEEPFSESLEPGHEPEPGV